MFKKFLCVLLIILNTFYVACESPGEACEAAPRQEPYVTNYTNEEHIERIEEITKNIQFEFRGTIKEMVECKAYIVYSFDEIPEYFYIIIQWKEPTICYNKLKKEVEEVYYSHIFGHIYNDNYYVYSHCPFGKGFWGEFNLLGVKKYALTGCLGYKDENDKFVFYSEYWWYEYDGTIHIGNYIKFVEDEHLTLEMLFKQEKNSIWKLDSKFELKNVHF